MNIRLHRELAVAGMARAGLGRADNHCGIRGRTVCFLTRRGANGAQRRARVGARLGNRRGDAESSIDSWSATSLYEDVVTDEMTVAGRKVAQLAFQSNGAQAERESS